MLTNYEIDQNGRTIWPTHLQAIAKECGNLSIAGLYALEEMFTAEVQACPESACTETRECLDVISEAIVIHEATEVAIVPFLNVNREEHQLQTSFVARLPLAS